MIFLSSCSFSRISQLDLGLSVNLPQLQRRHKKTHPSRTNHRMAVTFTTQQSQTSEDSFPRDLSSVEISLIAVDPRLTGKILLIDPRISVQELRRRSRKESLWMSQRKIPMKIRLMSPENISIIKKKHRIFELIIKYQWKDNRYSRN